MAIKYFESFSPKITSDPPIVARINSKTLSLLNCIKANACALIGKILNSARFRTHFLDKINHGFK